MKIHIDTDELVMRFADALRQHENQLLSKLIDGIVRKLRANPVTPLAGPRNSGPRNAGPKIMGIQLYALYPVSFVANRWEVSPDNVRKKSDVELPRSSWKGGEIRYRGIDILRYEGVDVEQHLAEAPSQLEEKHANRSTEPPHSNGRSSPPVDENGNDRPYHTDLPDLSGDSSSPD
jgi:hypothetical protein